MPAETCDPHYMETSPSSYGMQAARPESVCSSETTRQTSPSSSSVRSCPQARLSAVSSMTSSSIHKQVQREKRPREKEVVAPRSNKRYRTSDATSQAMPPASQAQQSLAVPAKAHHGPPNYVSRNQTSQDSCAPTGQAYLAPLPPPVQRPAQFYYHEGAPYHSLAGPPVNAPVHPTMAYMMAPSSSATTRSSQTLVAGRSRRPRTAPQPQTPVQNTAGNVCHAQGCGQSYASKSNLA